MFWCFEPWWRASFLRNYLFYWRDLIKRLMRRVPISVEYNFMKKSTGRIRLFISFRSTRVILLWFSGTLFINLTQVLLWCSDASSLDDEPWWRALMTSLDDVQWWSVVLEEGRQEDRKTEELLQAEPILWRASHGPRSFLSFYLVFLILYWYSDVCKQINQ